MLAAARAGKRCPMRTPALTSTIALALLTGCGSLISNQQEVDIGQNVHQQLSQQYVLVADDDPVSVWARDFVRPLEAASAPHRPPSEINGYKVAVIHDDDLVNAFAAPGGFTYLTTGLVLQASDCAEIAGVMGHELAHVTERHGVEAIEKAFAAEQLAAFFLDEGLAKDGALLIFQVLQSTKFSREDEAEGDEVGLQIAHDAGYSPYGLADFFGKLLALEKRAGGSALPEWLSSHPATADRVAAVKASIQRRYGASARPDQNRRCRTKTTLEAVKARIKGGQLKKKAGTGTKPAGG